MSISLDESLHTSISYLVGRLRGNILREETVCLTYASVRLSYTGRSCQSINGKVTPRERERYPNISRAYNNKSRQFFRVDVRGAPTRAPCRPVSCRPPSRSERHHVPSPLPHHPGPGARLLALLELLDDTLDTDHHHRHGYSQVRRACHRRQAEVQIRERRYRSRCVI